MRTINRRTMLAGLGALGATAATGGCVGRSPQSRIPFFERIGKPIGLQTFALGFGAGEDLGATFAMIREMGFGDAELFGLYGRSAREVRRLADSAGLPITGLHTRSRPLLEGEDFVLGDDPTPVVDVAEELGAPTIVIPFPVAPEGVLVRDRSRFMEILNRGFASADLEHWQAMADLFNRQGAAVAGRGLQLAYHNHTYEFAPVGGTTGWDVLLAKTDPDLLKIQLDIGWAAKTGRDPIAEMEVLGSRLLSLHMKDTAQGVTPSYDLEDVFTEAGKGITDWARLLRTAEALGVDRYYVDQEPSTTMPPAESVRQSLEFLKNVVA